MVDHIIETGHQLSDRVEEAMRTVARHLFVPEATVEEAYAEQAVITKRGSDGAALSCASVPSLVGDMLTHLDVHHGHRVLEIGAGTGWNAALAASLVGATGHVTTVDIDPDVTAQARRALNAAGYPHVRVATRDGVLGDQEHAPYDRLIVTVGAWDIPPAWWAQLKPGGRLVVPLRWRGQTRAVAFTHDGDRLTSDSVELCGFVPMLGADEGGELTSHIDPHSNVALYWDTDQSIKPAALHGVLDQPKFSAWTGATVHSHEPFDGIWLRLAASESGTCRIEAQPAAVTAGLCTPAIPARSPAIVEGDSLAYLAIRRDDSTTERRWELGAIGHGPAGLDLALRICEHIRGWDRDRTARPTITAYPAGTPDDEVPHGLVIDKRHIRLLVSFRHHPTVSIKQGPPAR